MNKAKSTLIILGIAVVVIYFLLQLDEQNLGGDYYYLPPYEAKDVGFSGGAIIYKSKEKYLYSDIKIKGQVLDVDHNDRFIIAVQLPIKRMRIQEPQLDEDDFDSLQFYIIEKKSDLVHGPYTEQEYIQRRRELGVTEKLKLNLNLDNLIP